MVVGAALTMTPKAVARTIPHRALTPTLVVGSVGWLVVALLAQRGSGSGSRSIRSLHP